MKTDMMGNWSRDCLCAQLTEQNVGQEVTVMGWVDTRRDLGGLIFIDVRDTSGVMQCVFDSAEYKDFAKVESLRNEYVVAIRGKVLLRDEETINPNIATGTIEVRATDSKDSIRCQNAAVLYRGWRKRTRRVALKISVSGS